VARRWLIAAIAWMVIVAAVCGWLVYDLYFGFREVVVVFGLFGVAPVVIVWGIRKIVAFVPRRVLMASIATLGAVALAYWVIVELEPFAHDGVSFETPAACAKADSKGARGNTIVSEWADGTLTVRTSLCINCADHVENVTAQVLGDRVLVNPRIGSGKMHAACDCERPLIIRLKELPKRDYQILGIPSYRYCM
jgi:hypothetical protein